MFSRIRHQAVGLALFLGPVLIALQIASSAAVAQTATETPRKRKVSECVPEPLRKGKNFTVAEPVANDGIWNIYSLQTEVGNLTVHGSFLLAERIQESHAIAELRKTDEIVLVGTGAANSMLHIGKSLYTVVSKPTETAEGLWPGLQRLGDRAGRTVRRTTEEMKSQQAEGSGGGQRSSAKKLAEESLSAAETYLGMQAIGRRWARKLGVDPYTTNADLRRELRRVAAYEAAGGAVTKTFAHVPLGLSIAVMISDLVWEKGPDELAKINEAGLAEMGIASETSQEFLSNKLFGLTRQTAIISSLKGLRNAGGRDAFVRQAAQADTEELAVFYTESAGMLVGFNSEQSKITTLVPDSVLLAALVEGNRVAFLVPADHVFWTGEFRKRATRATERLHGEYPGATLELWTTGKVSDRTKKGLASLGWEVHEQVLNRLSSLR